MQHHLVAILLDSGDTLIDEGTEIKNERAEVQRAELIPGASELVHELARRDYCLALVADGPVATFTNALGHHGLYDLFDTHAISETVGVEKPDASMFRTALDALGISPAEYGRTIMVGNNLRRDIAGANALGLISVWLDWSPRRSKTPMTALQVPDYTIHEPLELLSLLDYLEIQLAGGTPLRAVAPKAADIRSLAQKAGDVEIVCHKGANAYAPENTYRSAKTCLDWGIDRVEIDVSTSRDGVLYLLHGPTLEKTTNGQGNIADLDASEIDQLDAGSWFAPAFAGERVPRLEAFLPWIKGRARLFIDVKRADPEQLASLIRKNGMTDDVFFWFGDKAQASTFHRMAPDMALKINVSNPSEVIAAHETYNARVVEVALDNLTPELVTTCHQRDIRVMALQLDPDPAAYRQIINKGADMINVDHADLFVRVAAEWQSRK